MQATIIFHGHLMHQLVKYQFFITRLAIQYSFHSWFAYDQAFRLFISNNPYANWDQCNEEIYNVHVRGAQGRARCFVCGVGTTMLLCVQANTVLLLRILRVLILRLLDFCLVLSRPFSTLSLRDQQRAPQFCRNFDFRSCTFPSCRRIHRCFKCNQPHPASTCTSTRR